MKSFRTVLILSVFLLSACATTKFTQDSAQVSMLKGVVVVADSTVTRGRTIKSDTLSLAENKEIARGVAAKAEELLRRKGYDLSGEPVFTVGISAPAEGMVELVNDAGEEPAEAAPFLLSGGGAMDRDAAAKLFEKAREESLPAADSPFGDRPLLVINASGRYISGGAVVGNVAKGMLNVVAAVGAGLGGGGNVKFVEMDKDMYSLTFRLFDPTTGAMIWKDENTDSDNPDSGTFNKVLDKMVKKLPQAGK